MRVLVTGGAGYIGSHLVVALLGAGHDVVVLDNLVTGYAEAVVRAQELGGRPVRFVHGDVGDASAVGDALDGVGAVLHLAAGKMVGQSMEIPEYYFRNNLAGMAVLLEGMVAAGVRSIVYSSSAAVYGGQDVVPIPETAPRRPDSPYGMTKAHGEDLLDWMASRRGWSAISLRYFNPVGAHASGRIGEAFESAQSLVPRALMALRGGPILRVFGDAHPTPDGTCQRDYIHIDDLTRAHLVALRAIEAPGHVVYNVGTGRPHSVREVIASCGRVVGRPVPFVDAPPRPGDPAVSLADPSKMARELGYRAERSLDDMVASAWRWLEQNLDGYPK